MKKNPCFSCVCKPVCRLKDWYMAFRDCKILLGVMTDSDSVTRRKCIELIRSRKFFEMEKIL